MATRDMEIGGRKFQVRPFGAIEGSRVVMKLVGALGALQSTGDDTKDGAMVLGALGSLSDSDIDYVQRKALGCVDVALEGRGWTPILHEDGSWGVVDLETNAPLVLNLTLAVIVGALADFSAAGQAGPQESPQGSSQPD